MTSTGDIKIDLGIGTEKRGIATHNIYWSSPELVRGEQRGFPADIWAMGITGLEIVDGVPPKHHLTPECALSSIVNDPPPLLSKRVLWSRKMMHFFQVCLEKDPKRRPLARELLSHPFLSGQQCPDR